MENKQPFITTYKFYDSRKRRLSIFARIKKELENGKLEIEVFSILCSKKEVFRKKKARAIYHHYLNEIQPVYKDDSLLSFEFQDEKVMPVIYTLVVDGSNTAKEFINHCREMYSYKAWIPAYEYKLTTGTQPKESHPTVYDLW